MVRDILFAYPQAKAISLGSLGCKEGIKYLREIFLAYTTAGIRNRNDEREAFAIFRLIRLVGAKSSVK